MILGKACDLIDYHQQSKKPTPTASTPTKKEESTTALRHGSNAAVPVITLNHATNTPTKTSLKVSMNKYSDLQRWKAEDELADNSLDLSGDIPFSPITPRSIEATNQELRLSAIVLGNKIQTLFGRKRSSSSSLPQAVSSNEDSQNNLNAQSDTLQIRKEKTETNGDDVSPQKKIKMEDVKSNSDQQELESCITMPTRNEPILFQPTTSLSSKSYQLPDVVHQQIENVDRSQVWILSL